MARSDVLVTAEWAENNLNAPNTVFVEVDEDTSAYDTGHIEGAVRIDWKTDLGPGAPRLRRPTAVLRCCPSVVSQATTP